MQALGMTLALIVYKNGPPEMERQTSTMFFYIGGIAAITLVANALTAKSLLFALKLLGGDSAEKMIVMTSIRKKLRKQMRKALQELAMEFHFNEKELDEVRQSVSLLGETNISELMAAVATEKMEKEHKSARKNSLKIEHRASFFERPEAVGNPLHSSEAAAADSQSAPVGRNRRSSFDRAGGDKGSAHGAPAYGMIPEDEEEKGQPFDVIAMLEAGHNARPAPRSRGSSNADTMNRRLSMCGRGPMAMIMPQLLAYVRSTFLSMVRVHYWHDIEQGKLPRKSKSGKFLLYSIEVALDEVNLEAGGRDWACVESKLDKVPHEIQLLTWWEEHVPDTWFTYPSRYLNKLECTREERTVYIITSFIAAHENAQRKIHGYLRNEEDGGDDEQQSPEELKVIAESKLAVSCAGCLCDRFAKKGRW
jgi:hypothetical protein